MTDPRRIIADIHPIFVRESRGRDVRTKGITIPYVSDECGHSEEDIKWVIRLYRETLMPDGFTLPCRPNDKPKAPGDDDSWLYWLTTSPDEARPWKHWNKEYLYTRTGLVLLTDEAHLRSRATRGSSLRSTNLRREATLDRDTMASIQDAFAGVMGI